MLKQKSSKKGFTLLELIVVIMVLGIVASIGASIYAKVYGSYLLQKAKLSSSTIAENTIVEAANYLSYSLRSSLRAVASNGTTKPLDELVEGDTNSFMGIEWISKDYDGFHRGYWTGFADLDSAVSSSSFVKSTGSDFSSETSLLSSLYGYSNPGFLFSDYPSYYRQDDGTELDYNQACLYDGSCLYQASLSNERVSISGTSPGHTIFSELYILTPSAFSIIAEPAGNKYNLYMYYGYRPWAGESRSSGKKVLMAKNISVFRFTKQQDAIRLKVCSTINAGNKPIPSCVEKVVIK